MYARFCDASRAHTEQLYCLECRKPRTLMGNKLYLTLSMLCTATYTQNQTKCLMNQTWQKSGQDLIICIALTFRISRTKTLRVEYIGDEFPLRTVKVYALQIFDSLISYSSANIFANIRVLDHSLTPSTLCCRT